MKMTLRQLKAKNIFKDARDKVLKDINSKKVTLDNELVFCKSFSL